MAKLHHAGPHKEPPIRNFWTEAWRKRWENLFPQICPSFKASIGRIPHPHALLHHPEDTHYLGNEVATVAQGHREGLTGELVGVTGGKACVTPAGVGSGLETRVT